MTTGPAECCQANVFCLSTRHIRHTKLDCASMGQTALDGCFLGVSLKFDEAGRLSGTAPKIPPPFMFSLQPLRVCPRALCRKHV